MKTQTYILTNEGNEIIKNHKSIKNMMEYLNNELLASKDYSQYLETYFLNIDGHFIPFESKYTFDNRLY